MSEVPRVKGLAFRTTVSSLAVLRGREVQLAVMGSLGAELKDGLSYGAIVPGGWYPLAWYRELLRTIRSVTGEGKDLVQELGRVSIRTDMAGIYNTIAKLISPESLFRFSQRFFSSYFSAGSVQIIESRRGYTHARWKECREFDENVWIELLGACSQILEAGGARNVRARIVRGGGDDDDAMEATAHWS